MGVGGGGLAGLMGLGGGYPSSSSAAAGGSAAGGGVSMMDERSLVSHSPTPVLMVYNLPRSVVKSPQFFNLFSLYGNVKRVRTLMRPSDAAHVEFFDARGAADAVAALAGVPTNAFGCTLALEHSQMRSIAGPVSPDGADEREEVVVREFLLPAEATGSGSGSCRVAAQLGAEPKALLNRFTPLTAASTWDAEGLQQAAPSLILYFFNAPEGSTADTVLSIVTAAGGRLPLRVELLGHSGGGGDSSSTSSSSEAVSDSGSAAVADACGGGGAVATGTHGYLIYAKVEWALETVVQAANIRYRTLEGSWSMLRLSFASRPVESVEGAPGYLTTPEAMQNSVVSLQEGGGQKTLIRGRGASTAEFNGGGNKRLKG